MLTCKDCVLNKNYLFEPNRAVVPEHHPVIWQCKEMTGIKFTISSGMIQIIKRDINMHGISWFQGRLVQLIICVLIKEKEQIHMGDCLF